MNAQHNEMTMDEMDQVNGGFLLLLFYAIAPNVANAPAVGGKNLQRGWRRNHRKNQGKFGYRGGRR